MAGPPLDLVDRPRDAEQAAAVHDLMTEGGLRRPDLARSEPRPLDLDREHASGQGPGLHHADQVRHAGDDALGLLASATGRVIGEPGVVRMEHHGRHVGPAAIGRSRPARCARAAAQHRDGTRLRTCGAGARSRPPLRSRPAFASAPRSVCLVAVPMQPMVLAARRRQHRQKRFVAGVGPPADEASAHVRLWRRGVAQGRLSATFRDHARLASVPGAGCGPAARRAARAAVASISAKSARWLDRKTATTSAGFRQCDFRNRRNSSTCSTGKPYRSARLVANVARIETARFAIISGSRLMAAILSRAFALTRYEPGLLRRLLFV